MMLQSPLPVVDNFSSEFQTYIYKSRYARFLHDQGRREFWPETVKRYFDFFKIHLKEKNGYDLTNELRSELERAVLNLEVVPSMRCVMTAGPALERDNIAGYNCAYVASDCPRIFAEILYILMCGTGDGFSVERQFVNKLAEVPDELYPTDTIIIVNDSKLGWAKSCNELISLLYTGIIPKWDLSKLRPAGSILKTFGGRSSGPEPLDRLFKFIVQIFQNNKGQKLTSLDCYDIICMIGECVVVGGVRRSALLSLSNLSDDRMRAAKTGQWWTLNPHRRITNNSAVYTDKHPTMDSFMTEWKSLYDSKSGERGIFSRFAAKNVIERSNAFRKEHFGDNKDIRYRDPDYEWGTNPCSEIILRDKQFCNLSEVIVRASDTISDLKRKVRLATILGTFQSTLTDFRFLSKKWKDNTEDERLLGVSLTGIMDNLITSGESGLDKALKNTLTEMRKVVIGTNMEFAKAIGIPMSTASTAVKPSGTVSCLADSASGIHARHSPYYLRAVRSDKKDPLAQMLIDQGFPNELDQMAADNQVFYFPVKSPNQSVFRKDFDAIKQLDLWLIYQKYWCEHKPSMTVSVRDNEWLKVGAWVFDNFEWLSGISFLPFSDHSYAQAPFQDLTEEEYKKWVDKMPKKTDWNKLSDYENSDMTTGSQELGCVAGAGDSGRVSADCTI